MTTINAEYLHKGGVMDDDVECITFRSDKHLLKTFHRFQAYKEKSLLCDVKIVVGDKTINAHRLILAAFSDYFSAMFTGELSETTQHAINLNDLNAIAVEELIKYAYTATIEIRVDNVENLLSASCILQVDEVKQACSEFMCHQLHPSNCLGIRSFAEGHGCLELFKTSDKYTKDHFVDVVQNQEFAILAPESVGELISSDYLNVFSETQVFTAMIAWANYDLEKRKKHLPELLSHVRLPLLSTQYLLDQVEPCPLLRDSLPCRELIIEAMKYQLMPAGRLQSISPRTKPRLSTVGKLFAVGGMDSSKGAINIEEYDIRNNKWTLVGPMASRRLQFGLAVLEGSLYIVGGRNGLKTLNTVESYDPIAAQCTPITSMNTHRHGLGVAILNGPLYAVGGHDGWSYLSTVERYDPFTKQWSFVAPMSTPRSTVGVAVLDDKLYAVGGRDGSSCLNSVECYDPNTNRWTLLSPMLKRRGGVGVTVLGDFLYAVGGHDTPSSQDSCRQFESVERYDPKTDQWTVVSSMIHCRDAVGVCCVGDKLYAIGGYNGSKYLNAVEAFDPISNEWEEVASLNAGRAGACVVAITNNITKL